MKLISKTTLRNDVAEAFAHLKARAETEVNQLLKYERTAESVAQRLSEKLPERIAGRAGVLRDGALKKLRAAARQALEGEPDSRINAFRAAGCHKPIEAWAYEPDQFAVAAPTQSRLTWQGITVAAVVFVAGLAATFLATQQPEDNGSSALWRLLGVGASAVLAAVAAIVARQPRISDREVLIEQVDAYLNREKPQVEAWLMQVKEAYETCAAASLPSDSAGAHDA